MSLLAPAQVAYATERLTDALWGEMSPLWIKHYHECAKNKDIPLQPDRATYEQIQVNGALRVYTARESGKLIGYCVMFVAKNAHYSSITQSNQDILFVEPTMRGAGIGMALIRYTHEQLRDEGVTLVMQHSKTGDLDIGPLLKRLGYETCDIIYSKRLDK